MKKFARALVLLSPALSCNHPAWAQAGKVNSEFMITDVTVVNTANGALAQHQNVLIGDGKILSITTNRVGTGVAVKTINGSGKYLVPGFVDLHAHIMETATQTPSYFPLLLANGVTAFREESVAPAFVELAGKVNADSLAGATLAPEAIFQGVEEHQPPNQSAFDASNKGTMPSFDHLGAGLGLVLDCSTDADAIRKAVLEGGYKVTPPPPMDFIQNPRVFDAVKNAPFYQRVLDTYSETQCKTLAQTFARNGTWQTLTLIRLRTQDYGDDPIYRGSANLDYISKGRKAQWDALGERFAALPPDVVTTLQRYYELQKHVSKLMIDNGVKILAGSDVGGVWLVPGVSLHQEFHELAAAGLSPLQVLQTTTLNAAEFLNRLSTMGTVEKGKNADLVLLEANPMSDVANFDKIYGVFLRGNFLSKDELKTMKADVAAAYK